MNVNRDLAYKHLDEAEKIISNLKFKIMFSLYPTNGKNMDKLDNIKHLISSAENILLNISSCDNLLNSDKNVQVSDTTEADSSFADHQIKISELREKFFKECVDRLLVWPRQFDASKEDNTNTIFEWFKPYLKIPSIDWEGLEKAFYKWKEDYCDKYTFVPTPLEVMDFFKTNLQDYIK